MVDRPHRENFASSSGNQIDQSKFVPALAPFAARNKALLKKPAKKKERLSCKPPLRRII
jgi:hypothetical protein